MLNLEVIWAGNTPLTQWPERDWHVLRTREGYQAIWDIEPRTSAHLLAEMVRNQRGVTLDAEAWHDNALVRTTSKPRLMNTDRLAEMRQRWARVKRESARPWDQPPPPPPKPLKARVVDVHRVATGDELIAELQQYERLAVHPDEPQVCSLTNKIRHSKLSALQHRNQLALLPGERHPERLEVYKCKTGCGDWHVGHRA